MNRPYVICHMLTSLDGREGWSDRFLRKGHKDTDGSSTDVILVDENGTVSANNFGKWIQDLIKAGVANQELYQSKKITTEGTDYAAVTVTTEAGQKTAVGDGTRGRLPCRRWRTLDSVKPRTKMLEILKSQNGL